MIEEPRDTGKLAAGPQGQVATSAWSFENPADPERRPRRAIASFTLRLFATGV
jgi:hypothetical protein